MGCIEELKYEVLLSRVSFRECREYIKEHYKETYTVKPGYKVFDSYIIGVPPVAMGVRGKEMLFPYVKPCHGTFVMGIDSEEEIARLRENEAKKIKKTMKKGGLKEKAASGPAPVSFDEMYRR